ncbi:MAG: type II toxin-antitoxin system VapC family toxin [Anaerolineales bacterium]|nr:MAG: type II toxin-antitoxin system VapC family toxin [Anaerolineales bacterium]
MGVDEFRTALNAYGVIGLDAMSFIYHFEKKPHFGPITKVLFAHIQAGKVSAVISVLVAGEVLTGVKKVGNREMILRYRHIFSEFPNLALHDADMQVMEKMSDLRVAYGLKTPDAIHVAAALLNGAQAFVTNDAGLKRVNELDVLVLEDYVERRNKC